MAALLRGARGLLRASSRPTPWPLSRTPTLFLRTPLSTAVPTPPDSTAPVVEVDASNFESLVIRASQADPPAGGAVILDAYADWCGPCKELTPRLERLVLAQAGAVRLAKLNVDSNQELAQSLQIASLPTVMLVHKGKLVESFKGALPEAELAAFVKRAADLAGGAGAAERAAKDAEEALARGDTATAEALFGSLRTLPEHAADGTAGLALCALKRGDLGAAQNWVALLLEKHKDDAGRPLARRAIAQAELAAQAGAAGEGAPGLQDLRDKVAESPGDMEAKHTLAQRLVAEGEHKEAVDVCLAMVKQDRAWGDEAGKALLMKLFESLGDGHPLTRAGRRRLGNILFS